MKDAVTDDVEALRAFNRLYTRELGLLGRRYLGSGLGMAELRVLWELGHGAAAGARDLARRLGLDEGYLSRVLRGFERRGWLARERLPEDARRFSLVLTPAGQAALAPFEARSRAEIADRLGRMPDTARQRFVTLTAELRALLGDDTLGAEPVRFHDLAPGDAGWVIERHGALYAAEEGYDQSFEGLVAGIIATYLDRRDPACDRAWIAWSGGRRLGSVFCVRESDDTAKLRLFFLEPDARGRGLGRRMLTLCMDHARDCGYRRMVLWTHESHRAACALYAAAGFRLTGSVPARAFGCDVVEQSWEISL